MNDKARSILRYIIAYKSENDGRAPTMREIMIDCQVSSTSMVDYYLTQLELLDLIRRGDKGLNRAIQVTGGQWVYREAEA